MSNYYLAVDIGASSGRHILGSVENRKIVIEEVYRFQNGMTEKNGRKCWDHEALFNSVLAGIRHCAEIGKKPSFMGIDTWGVDFALIGKDGNIIGDTVGYRDSRTDGMDKKVSEMITEPELYARTGIQKQIFNTIYQLMSLKTESPDELLSAENMLMMPDYLNYRLTGVMHQEYTNATTSGLVNIRTGEWDKELIGMLGYPEGLFGKLSHPGDEVGKLCNSVEKEVGFNLTVLHVTSHDTASAVLAVPMKSERSLYISSGTWSLMGIETPEAIVSDRVFKMNLTNEGGYEMRYRLLKNIMGLWIIQSVKKELGGKYSFAELCDMAQKCGDTPYRIDVNDAAFLAPDSMISAIKKHCGKEDMPLDVLLCCVYRSLADSYATTLKEIISVSGRKPDALHIIGGGSKDDYLNSLTAQSCGIPVYAGPVEATAIGNLVAQMLSQKEFATVTDARAAIGDSFDIKRIDI